MLALRRITLAFAAVVAGAMLAITATVLCAWFLTVITGLPWDETTRANTATVAGLVAFSAGVLFGLLVIFSEADW